MLKHKLITQVKVKNHSGETFRIALVETDTDYVIAHYYKGKNDSWGNGDYLPKVNTNPAGALTCFASTVASYGRNISTETIKF